MKRVLIFIAGILLATSVVQADLNTDITDYMPTITVSSGMGVQNQWQHQYGIDEFELNEGTGNYILKQAMTNAMGNIIIQACEFNPDPTVFVSQLIYNNTTTAKTYQITIDQPAYLVSNPSMTYGSVTLSLLDVDGYGSSLADNGTPIYKAFIDTNPAGTLLPPSYSLSTPPGTVADSSPAYFLGSYPGGVASNIAIQIEFTLSPGDKATVQSRFDVIPEPASMVLLVAASSAIVFIRRKFCV